MCAFAGFSHCLAAQDRIANGRTTQALTFEVHLPNSRYDTGEQRHRFHERFQARIAALPGVTAVGATSWLPMNGRYNVWGPVRRLDGESNPIPNFASGSADVRIIAGDAFQALGVSVLRGMKPRDLAADGEDVVWISRSVANQIAPEENPIGLLVYAANRPRRVVGVVDDVAIDARADLRPTIYLPHAQYADNRNWALTQVVRASGNLAQTLPLIEHELSAIDAGLVLFRAKPFDGILDQARAQDRFALLLMSAFALLAVMLVAVGTYGVLAGSVARRRREIGIRMALGADNARVRGTILRKAFVMAAVGAFFGLAIAWSGSRWLASLLYEVRPTDPWAYFVAMLLVLSLGLAAGLLSARRATRIAPASSLAS